TSEHGAAGFVSLLVVFVFGCQVVRVSVAVSLHQHMRRIGADDLGYRPADAQPGGDCDLHGKAHQIQGSKTDELHGESLLDPTQRAHRNEDVFWRLADGARKGTRLNSSH